MILHSFLLEATNVGDLVIFKHEGYTIGCTMIDHEDLFLGSLSQNILNMKVVSSQKDTDDSGTKIFVDLAYNVTSETSDAVASLDPVKEKRKELYEDKEVVLEKRGDSYFLSLYNKNTGAFMREVCVKVKDDGKVALSNYK